MAGNQGAPLTLDQMLQESRQKRKAETLAQQIFGKKNRSRTPVGPRAQNQGGAGGPGSLASRVGVTKRPSSVPRSNTAPPRNARPPPPQVNRPAFNDNTRARTSVTQPSSEPVSEAKSNGSSKFVDQNGAGSISFRGAASTGPHIVIAQNFAPGTSAADIESVMADVGGSVVECHLVAATPTVIAEITFAEKSGAETVINTFNGKKADGRTLNVYLKAGGGAKLNTHPEEVPPPADDVMMEVDENAQAREAEDRLREERRRAPLDNFPTGPKGDRGYDDDYYRGPRRAEPAYQDGRYGYNGGYNGGRGRDNGRLYYSDRNGRGGQSWRP